MATNLDLSKLSLMDALDLATLIEEEALKRYTLFAQQLGATSGGKDAGTFFAKMAENEAKHGTEIHARRLELFGKTPTRMSLHDLFDVEAPDVGAARAGMSTLEAFELAMSSEQKAFDFFDSALASITDADVIELFTELRDEEAEHLAMLKEEVAKLPSSAGVATEYDEEDAPYL